MSYLEHLRTFLAIYRGGSLSGAGRVLNLTQPAVSGHLKSLEQKVGQTLFVRQARGVRATPAGDYLARQIEPMIDGLELVYKSVRQDAEDLSGAVHIGGPSDFMTTRVLPSLAKVVQDGIAVRTRFGDAADLIEKLKAGDLDLVLATVRIAAKQLDYIKVYDEDFHLVGAPIWRQASPSPQSLLNTVPLLAYGENLAIVRRFFQAQGVSVDGVSASMTVPDLRGLLTCAEAGAGMTVLPGYLCREALETGRLVRLYHGKAVAPNALYVACSKKSARTPRTAYVLDRLVHASARW